MLAPLLAAAAWIGVALAAALRTRAHPDRLPDLVRLTRTTRERLRSWTNPEIRHARRS